MLDNVESVLLASRAVFSVGDFMCVRLIRRISPTRFHLGCV